MIGPLGTFFDIFLKSLHAMRRVSRQSLLRLAERRNMNGFEMKHRVSDRGLQVVPQISQPYAS
jgi:hypothetical protein